MANKKPRRRTDTAPEGPVESRKNWVDTLDKIGKAAHDGPAEVDDAARQETEYPADETDEG